MLRGLIILVFISGSAFLIAPFLLSSLALDERGITIPGRVNSKSETVTVHYSDWKRSSEATLRCEPPDAHSVTFFTVSLTPAQYDALHIGDTLNLHYLPRRDVPAVPMSNALWQMHMLPILRLADRRTFTGVEQVFTPSIYSALEVIAGMIVLLIVLRKIASPLFGWVLGVTLAAAFGWLMVYNFPRPTPKPAAGVLQTMGRVKSMSRIERMFQEDHSRGEVAAQPVDVVGVEFVPAGKTESVVAVDLIDAGSVAGLKENSTVRIDYEANSPRTAYIVPATRNFVSRNVHGLAVEAVACLAIVVVLFFLSTWMGRGYRRLLGRKE